MIQTLNFREKKLSQPLYYQALYPAGVGCGEIWWLDQALSYFSARFPFNFTRDLRNFH